MIIKKEIKFYYDYIKTDVLSMRDIPLDIKSI